MVLHFSTRPASPGGTGGFEVGFGLRKVFPAVSFGLMAMLFGNMVEASVASIGY